MKYLTSFVINQSLNLFSHFGDKTVTTNGKMWYWRRKSLSFDCNPIDVM